MSTTSCVSCKASFESCTGESTLTFGICQGRTIHRQHSHVIYTPLAQPYNRATAHLARSNALQRSLDRTSSHCSKPKGAAPGKQPKKITSDYLLVPYTSCLTSSITLSASKPWRTSRCNYSTRSRAPRNCSLVAGPRTYCCLRRFHETIERLSESTL